MSSLDRGDGVAQILVADLRAASAGCPCAPGRRSSTGPGSRPRDRSAAVPAPCGAADGPPPSRFRPHPLGGRRGARRARSRPVSTQLDQADQAGRRRLVAVEVAQRGDVDAQLAGAASSTVVPRRHFDFAVVDGQTIGIGLTPRYTACSGQTWRQVSQRVHFSRSIVCRA